MIKYALGALVASVIWYMWHKWRVAQDTGYEDMMHMAIRDSHRKMHEANELRRVLEMVEWVIDRDYCESWIAECCPWCNGEERIGHAPDCPRQAALNCDSDVVTGENDESD